MRMLRAVLMATVLSLACGQPQFHLPATTPTRTLVILPKQVGTYVGDTVRYEALFTTATGSSVVCLSARWMVADTAVARITAQGFLIARATGQTSVSAQCNSQHVSAPVIVRPRTQRGKESANKRRRKKGQR